MGSELSLKKAALLTGGAVFLALALTVGVPWLLSPSSPSEEIVGKSLPDVSVVDDAQSNVALLDLVRAAKPDKMIVALWATWCEPCLKELPVLEGQKERLASEGYRLTLVNYDGGAADKTIPEVKAWFVSQKLSLTTLFDFRISLLDSIGVSALPFAFVVDSEAKIVWAAEGLIDWESVRLP